MVLLGLLVVGCESGGDVPSPTDPVAAPAGWLRVLETGDVYRRRAAASELGRAGVEVVPALVDLLEHPNETVRRHVVDALGPHGEAALAGLRVALADSALEVRARAARAVRAIGPAGLPAFDEALRHPHHAVREDAVAALPFWGAAAVPRIQAALEDDDGRVRWLAASALAEVGTEEALARLGQIASGEDALAREAQRLLRRAEQS